MSSVALAPLAPEPLSEDASDLIWGVAAIAKVIGRKKAATYYLLRTGSLDGAVSRIGRHGFVGSRRALLNLPFLANDRASEL
jgi:hypothetical protein